MSLKIIGAVLIIATCGGVGISMAATHRRDEKGLRSLIGALNLMECELQFRLTALPELCRNSASAQKGEVGQVLDRLAMELDGQVAPDVETCMEAAIGEFPKLSPRMRRNLQNLGHSLGKFDLNGQLKGLAEVRSQCALELNEMSTGREIRLRGYQTLGFCVGAALAILFI